jgi:hypothetical protein
MPGIQKWFAKRFGRHTKAKAKNEKETLTSTASADATVASFNQPSENVRIVTEWIESWSHLNAAKVMALSDENCEYVVPMSETETMYIDLKDFVEQMELCWKSFPDFTNSWKSIEDYYNNNKDGSTTTVIITHFVTRGTHTGEPFAFGPYPAIEAKGTPIKSDPISLIITLRNGKPAVIKPQTNGAGAQLGPISYYTQIGGIVM